MLTRFTHLAEGPTKLTERAIKVKNDYCVFTTVCEGRSEVSRNLLKVMSDPLLAKRATKFIKSCRSRRNPLNDDNL